MAESKAVKKVSSLVDGLRECWPDFNMTVNEFLNPTRENIAKFYERFVKECGIRPEVIISKYLQHYNQQDFKDYEEILNVYVLYSCVNHFLDFTSLQSLPLTLNDLLKPSADKNLLTRISLLANYQYFVKVWTEKTILPIKENVLREVNAAKHLKKKMRIVNDHLKSTAFKLTLNIDRIATLSDEKQNLTIKITLLQTESEEYQKEIPTSKHKLQITENENDKLIESIEKNMIKQKQLKALIVNDPEAILAENRKLENDLAEEEMYLKSFVKTLELKTNTYSLLLKNNEVFNNFQNTFNLTQILDTHHSIEEQRDEKERINKKMQIAQNTEKELLTLKSQLNDKLLESEKKFQDLTLQANRDEQLLLSEFDDLSKEYEEISKKLETSTCEEKELKETLKYIQNCCEEYKEKIEKQDEFYEKLFSTFMTEKQALDDKVIDIMNQIKDIVKD